MDWRQISVEITLLSEYKETIQDLNLKYSDSFVMYEDELTYVSEFSYGDRESLNIYLCGFREFGADVSKFKWDGSLLDSIVVKKGFFSLNSYSEIDKNLGLAWLVSRRTDRQNRKSLSRHNHSVTSFLNSLYATIPGAPGIKLSMDLKIVQDIVNPTYTEWTKALEKCLQFRSVPVSPDFAIFLNNQAGDRFLLANKFAFIGSLNHERQVIIHHKLAGQEFLDFKNRYRLDIEILHA